MRVGKRRDTQTLLLYAGRDVCGVYGALKYCTLLMSRMGINILTC